MLMTADNLRVGASAYTHGNQSNHSICMSLRDLDILHLVCSQATQLVHKVSIVTLLAGGCQRAAAKQRGVLARL